MSKPGRSGVIRFAEAQAGIPGPAGERAVMVLQRGTLDVALGLPLRPSQQTPHAQDEISSFAAEEYSFTTASGTGSSQATFCSWLRGPSISSRTLPRTSPCGVYFTALMVASSKHRAWRW
jgi:hypothetical protein